MANYSVEQLNAYAEKEGLDSAERFIATLDERVVSGVFIGNTQIELAKLIAPQKAESYIKARADFYEKKRRQELDEATARAKAEAEADAQEKAEQLALTEKEKAKFLGWADDMTPLRFGKVLKTLSGMVRQDGVLKPTYQFIIDVINDGYRPEMREGVVSYYGSKWNPQKSKPRTEYCLQKDGSSYKVNKTEYEFAQYLTQKAAGQ